MKIQTSDCVLAIIKYFEDKEIHDYNFLNTKMWKRLSKTGSGDNIVRTFQNKSTGDIVYVISSETEILSVSEEKPSTSKIKDFSSFTKPTKPKYTVKQLDDWMMDNGEDVLQDGPFKLSNEDMIEFAERVKANKKIVKAMLKSGEVIEDEDEIDWDHLTVSGEEKEYRLILKEFVDFLNEKDIKTYKPI